MTLSVRSISKSYPVRRSPPAVGVSCWNRHDPSSQVEETDEAEQGFPVRHLDLVAHRRDMRPHGHGRDAQQECDLPGRPPVLMPGLPTRAW